ncbi:OLC1v1012842C1 [Oldenlandia corymbosa var. corymbosa]|nr:OLC1v1012842C1 [Oldenlandia corymbosa var. corymbosa]
MGGSRKFCFSLLLSLTLLEVLHLCSAIPSCLDSSTPLPYNVSAAFCPYNGSSCCNSSDDLNIRNQFKGMNISDPNCASLVQSLLCARCDPFAAELFRIESSPWQVPVICNSTVLPNSTQASQAENNFCAKVWTTCQNVSMMNSPFSPGGGAKSNLSKLSDAWQSQSDFCNAFGGLSEDGGVCFAGEPVILNKTDIPPPPSGLCLEKIGNGSYLSMVPHPDGSNRAFFSNQEGKIWLATIPKQGSGGSLELDEASPFLDLSDEVDFDTEFGMMGIAVHPNFVKNGRFFASFNCDKTKWPGCGGRCSCNSDLNCDPSQLPSDDGSTPCQYSSVIAEFTVNGSASQPSMAKTAQPSEVRRIFTMGLPFTSHHGGQILFGPTDGYLYFMMGDGGNVGDPYNFAQNKKSLLGKIMRLDVDSIPSATEISQLELWGNYSIPKDNPYTEDKDLKPEIWALGLRNPWRCSFDSARPSYFLCGDVGQDSYEEVNLITKNGNYGWRTYEGPNLYNPPSSPGGNTSANSIKPIFPVMGYNHSAVNEKEGSASITGGYFYRSETDPCTFGK